MVKDQFSDANDGIAIIGMSGRLPRAGNLDEFWHNLRNGVDCISDFSDEELMDSGIDPTLIRDPAYVKRKGIIDAADLFDAHFFGINPGEAEVIDPQQRLFLETAYEVLEKAGYTSDGYPGPVGVYAGCSLNTYLISNLFANLEAIQRLGAYQIMVANDKDFLSTRTSYKLNLSGPSLTIQTACSTSLVTVHLACQGLLNYECDMALAGGISVAFPQRAGYLYQEGMILSPDGHCRAFDADAQGIVAGEGVGVVLLKRLDDALTDGDNILAVIKGSAINNDGSLKAGYTAPSVDGQAEVIAAAHAMAGIDASSISYVETHGTGTSLGDPIEIAALTKAFRHGTDANGNCAIGSVKTNIGHLDVAAGVASLIKIVLALQHKELPPSLHFQTPNPHIDFKAGPFYVNTRLADWNTDGHPRRAGVSSFGIGGTNAHMVVEEAPVREPSGASRPCQLLLLSAKTAKALDTATAALADHLSMDTDANFADVAYTLKVGRQRYGNRRMAVCRSREEAVSILGGPDPQQVRTRVDETLNRPVVFMFSGQGAQYVNMGLDLYRREPAYRDAIDACSGVLQPLIKCDLREILYPDAAGVETASRQLAQTEITQPALFTVEYALVKLWEQWGIQPQAMIGHSIGEYVAACRAGVFTLDQALALVARRGRLIQSLPTGAMLAVGMSENEIMSHLDENVSLAAVNSTAMCVVSGENGAVAELEKSLEAKGTGCMRLKTSHAFHSKMMDPILDEFTQFVSKIDLKPPVVGFVSNVTGTWITTEEATDPQYWARHLRHTVRFADGTAELLKDPSSVFLEIGPGHTLVTLVERHGNTSPQRALLSSIRHPKKHSPDDEFIIESLGRLWMEGVDVHWKGYYHKERRYRVPLPTYPFERERFWIEPGKGGLSSRTSADQPLSKSGSPQEWFYTPQWKRTAVLPRIHDETDQWLVFVDQHGLGHDLAQQLGLEGREAICVFAGDGFANKDRTTYVVDPLSETDFDRLFEALKETGGVPQKVAYLWSFDIREGTGSDEVLNPTDTYAGFHSLLFLVRSLGERIYAGKVDINVVCNGLYEVVGTENLNSDLAVLLGPCKVIPQEYQHFSCRIIDFACTTGDDIRQQDIPGKLLCELDRPDVEDAVAYRGAHRWTQFFDSVNVPEAGDMPKPILNEGGVYLITGGMGGIGLVLAQYLATRFKARLILIGRSAFPEKKEWDRWIDSHGEEDRTSLKIKKLLQFEAQGAEILVVSADVCSMEQMKHVKMLADDRFGKVDGIIHAAGMAGGSIIQRTTVKIANDVLAPKVGGAKILAALFGRDAQFLCFCSSINAVLGGMGQVAYCAANAFLDVFAMAKHNECGHGLFLSIGWDTWQEVGMAVDTDVPEQLRALRQMDLENGIRSREGVEIFRRALGSDLSHMVISTRNLQLRHLAMQPPSLSAAASETTSEHAELKHNRPDLSNQFVPPDNEIEMEIALIWQNLLGLKEVGIRDNFFELGGHSLLGTQVTSQFYKKWQIQIPLRKLFDHPTIDELAKIVETMLQNGYNDPISEPGAGENREIFEI
jgi:acyl transferase domain-containing protein